MSVATVKTRLASIQANIAGLNRAFAQAPNSINRADMPLFVNLTRQSQTDWQEGSDLGRETRLYLMQLYVLPFGNGIPGEAERTCEPFFPLVRDTFAARPGLEGLLGVQQAVFLGDGGVAALRYPLSSENLFWGIEFRLQVSELVERSYVGTD